MTPFPYTLITGAGSGLGKCFALEFARRGRNLILCDIQLEKLQKTALEVREKYLVNIEILSADLSNKPDLHKMIKSIKDKNLSINCLVNNAGQGGFGDICSGDPKRWEDMTAVNVQALTVLCCKLTPLLKKHHRAHILNIASMSAFYPLPHFSVYSSSKAYNLNFSLALREELASCGISVSVFCPNGIYTGKRVTRDIKLQGFWGEMTALYPQNAAHIAVEGMLSEKAVIVPKLINKAMRAVGSLLPRRVIAQLMEKRWKNIIHKIENGDPFGPPDLLNSGTKDQSENSDPSE